MLYCSQSSIAPLLRPISSNSSIVVWLAKGAAGECGRRSEQVMRHSRGGDCLKRVYALDARLGNKTRQKTQYGVSEVALHPVIELLDMFASLFHDPASGRIGIAAPSAGVT